MFRFPLVCQRARDGGAITAHDDALDEVGEPLSHIGGHEEVARRIKEVHSSCGTGRAELVHHAVQCQCHLTHL